ncbi:MAG TPA: HAMP domain-containing sensor histidine kinase [Acidimicrobiia bacterium]
MDIARARQHRFRTIASVGAAAVCALGVLVFVAGWGLGAEWLTRPVPFGETMKANTALCLSLLGLSLLLRIDRDVSDRRRWIGKGAALLVMLVALATLIEYLGSTDLGIDRLFFSESGATVSNFRPAPNTALTLALLGLGLLCIDGRRWLTVTPTVLALLIGFISTAGYVLGIEGLYGISQYNAMSAHTAVALMIIAGAALLARPDQDPAVRLSWADSGGTVARLLLPLFGVLFVATTWVIEVIVDRTDGVIPPEAVLIENVLTTSMLLVLTWLLAGAFHRSEERKREIVDQDIRNRDRFVASVGHELRTPLTAVVGFADLLAEMEGELPSEERKRIFELMAQEGADLVAMLEDVLVAARTDIGALSVARVRVNLRAQVAQAVEGLTGSGSAVEKVVGDEVFVEGDPLRVRQILRNLLTNAQRYGGERVRVEIGRIGSTGVVQVLDDGAGIASEDEAGIFEPYVTMHGQAGRPGSVGLGLPVARGLATRMGGDLVYKRVEGWTAFELSLPLYQEAAHRLEPSDSDVLEQTALMESEPTGVR